MKGTRAASPAGPPAVRASLGRCLLVWLGATLGLLALLLTLLPQVSAGPGLLRDGAPFDQLLVWLAATALLCCGGWLWLVTSVVVGQAASGSTSLRRLPGCPTAVRRLVLALCGVALTTGVAAPTFAVSTEMHGPESTLSGLPYPDRATAGDSRRPLPVRAPVADRVQRGDSPEVDDPAPHRASPREQPPGPGRTHGSMTVHHGDSLWRLSSERLGPAASNAEIARAVRALHRANHDHIDDPDLIHPGQHLRLPSNDGEF